MRRTRLVERPCALIDKSQVPGTRRRAQVHPPARRRALVHPLHRRSGKTLGHSPAVPACLAQLTQGRRPADSVSTAATAGPGRAQSAHFWRDRVEIIHFLARAVGASRAHRGMSVHRERRPERGSMRPSAITHLCMCARDAVPLEIDDNCSIQNIWRSSPRQAAVTSHHGPAGSNLDTTFIR